MNTLKANRIFSALICLTLMLALTIGNVSASPKQQTETDFAAIDAYVTEQMNNLVHGGINSLRVRQKVPCLDKSI